MATKTKSTISANGKTADMDDPVATAEVLESVVEELLGKPNQPVRMRGKLLKALVKGCCAKPQKDMAEMPLDSVAIGQHSIAATDRYVAVSIGEPEDSYRTTSRKSALLESERENLYLDIVDFTHVEALADPMTGEVRPYPDIGRVLSGMKDMKSVGTFYPELILKAAQIAVAANSRSIELLQSKDGKLLGFKFEVVPDEDQFDLFEGATENIPSCGVIAARDTSGKPGNDEEEDES